MPQRGKKKPFGGKAKKQQMQVRTAMLGIPANFHNHLLLHCTGFSSVALLPLGLVTKWNEK
jgi:hypothetical protein